MTEIAKLLFRVYPAHMRWSAWTSAWGDSFRPLHRCHPMITHYIPQWLLSRFGKPVYELDIYNGHVSTRTLSKAGSHLDLWPEEIEKELMGTHDNDAARVFRYWINGRRRIVLPDRRRST